MTEATRAVTEQNQIEEQQSVQGYRETQQELEKVSSEKAATDEEKDRTLQEFSHMVHALNVSISEKKANLAPLLRGMNPFLLLIPLLGLLIEKSINLLIRSIKTCWVSVRRIPLELQW